MRQAVRIVARRDGGAERMQAVIYVLRPDDAAATRLRLTVPPSVTSRSGAQRWAEQVRRDVEAGKPPPQTREGRKSAQKQKAEARVQGFTLREVVDAYLADLRGRGAAESSVRTQRDKLRLVLDVPTPAGVAVGDVPLARVGEAEASAVRSALVGAGYSQQTTNMAILILQAALSRCHVLGLRGPVERLGRVGGRQPKTPRAYDDATFEAVVAAARDLGAEHLALVLLGGDAALRVGEVVGLEVDDVDLRRRVLHVRRSVSPRGEVTPPKGGEEREVPMTARLVDALAPLVAERGGDEPLLPGDSRGRYVSRMCIRKRLARALSAVGLPPKGLHTLRHSCATSALVGGADVVAVQHMLGHATPETTVRMYLHDTGGAAARAVAAVERARANAATDTNLTRAPRTKRIATGRRVKKPK